MYRWITICAFLFVSASHAEMKVGTTATMVGWVQSAKGNSTRTLVKTILDLKKDAYLEQHITYTIETHESSTQQNWERRLSNTGLPDGKAFNEKNLVTSCVWYHGKVEVIKVPAGTFRTCKVQTTGYENYTDWYGPVPFVIVKSLATSSRISYGWELQTFSP